MKTLYRRMRSKPSSVIQRHNSVAGFTMVETVIVLAIASLILIIIFLAIPAAQRSVRNHDRKAAADYILAQMESYKADHGNYPIEAPVPDVDDRLSFVNSLNSGPSKGYHIRYTDDGPSHSYPYAGPGAPADPMDTLDEISITPGHLCNPSAAPGDKDYPIISVGTWGTDYKAYAVYTVLEKAPLYCVDNEFERATTYPSP